MIKTNIKKNLLRKMPKAIILALAFTLPLASAFSQELEEPDLEELEDLEDYEGEDYSFKPNPDIQRPIIIIDTPWNYDLNPQTANFASEAQVLSGLYEGLFSYNPYTLSPDYALCESYKISRDKKRWTFTIREGATFSNGEPITAKTFRDSWITLLSNPDAMYASSIDCIVGAKEYRNGKTGSESVKIIAKDDRTLAIYLTEPTEHLPYLLCHHSLVAVSKDKNVYSGAFTLKSFRSGILRMVKNEKYWDAENVYIPSITIMQSKNEDDIIYRYNNGKADWITYSASPDKLIEKDDYIINAEFGTMFYFFKMRNNVWQYPEFRQAIFEAIPYEELRKNYYFPATTLVFPLSGYPSVTGWDETDLDDAKELLSQAKKKYNIAENEKLKLTIAVSKDESTMEEFAKLIKEQLEKLDIEIVLESKPYSEYNSSISTWEADLFSYGWVGDYADPLAFLELFKGDSTLNVGKYKNSEYDDLIFKATTTENATKRYEYLSQAEQVLLDDAEVIPLNHFIASNIINTKEIGGWYKNALDIHPLKYLYIKEYKYNLDGLVYFKRP